jgi:hypothetical protein
MALPKYTKIKGTWQRDFYFLFFHERLLPKSHLLLALRHPEPWLPVWPRLCAAVYCIAGEFVPPIVLGVTTPVSLMRGVDAPLIVSLIARSRNSSASLSKYCVNSLLQELIVHFSYFSLSNISGNLKSTSKCPEILRDSPTYTVGTLIPSTFL